MMRGLAALATVALAPAPALAQYIGGAPPPLPSAPAPGEIQTPAGTLARAVRVLARSPRDFSALITAGRAALDLGDTQAAIGFFGRAEEVRPSDPAPKIGMGAATVATGDADGALRWFFEAQRLGATGVTLGADRGLAQDLLGNQASAQIDYRAALGGRETDEARRRLSLSLGISGNRTEAFTALQPLLARRDPAAQRIRAFVLALVGDERGASSAIDQAMPGSGARMAGFFRLLPTLSASQKAAAVHLGVFPDPSEIRVATVSSRIIAPPSAHLREQRVEVPVSRRDGQVDLKPASPATTSPAPRTRLAEATPSQRFAGSSFEIRRPTTATRPAPRATDPRPTPPPAQTTAPLVTVPPSNRAPAAPGATTSVSLESFAATTQRDPVSSGAGIAIAEPPPVEATTNTGLTTQLALASTASPTPVESAPADTSASATSFVAVSGDRLSGIDRLLAQADELPVPPAPTPRFEKQKEVAAADPAKARKAGEESRRGKKLPARRRPPIEEGQGRGGRARVDRAVRDQLGPARRRLERRPHGRRIPPARRQVGGARASAAAR